MTETPKSTHLGPLWSRGDCRALAALVAGWGAALAAAWVGTVPLGEPIDTDGERVALVAEKIDPNTASVGSLRRLPMIGPVKARAIVAYRRAARAAGRREVFRRREDLSAVPGIGPATVKHIGAYLALPPRPAPGQP